MTLPPADTVVLFPDGTTSADAVVLHTEPRSDGRLAVLLDRTPVHPVDPGWPDQGADRATVTANGTAAPLDDAVVGATDGTALYVGEDVPVRRGTEGWAFVVVHLLAGDAPLAEGDAVRVQVDERLRRSLSAGHTACHLASLALDAALAESWTKPVDADPLGAPAFDRLAIERSTILPGGAEDAYRVGKSLRRRGFDPAALGDTDTIAAAADALLAAWLGTGAGVRIERTADGLGDLREWVCDLPEGTARLACGGTHLASLGELEAVTVRLETAVVPGATTLTMTTTARLRDA
ncbi:metal-dependent hydrolase [Amnibacterium sp. CER49]|uniref:metal-dependent hydrolase n=1 Tax=Amnibacterium sp. CER49 TaxID=3039161 RepID=UPI0024491617|nr:metal-dependent hydrolase [Amnibacterium sp. CER49]MDH2443483.1 metal-dependent hydrolase [Amnibacterium sp. CER49]